MWDEDGVHDIYRAWNKVLAEYPNARALAAEAWVNDIDRMARYVRSDEMQQAFNFAYLSSKRDAENLREVITESLGAVNEVNALYTSALYDHDALRHDTRPGLHVPGCLPQRS